MLKETIIHKTVPIENLIGLDEAKKVLEQDLLLRAIKDKPQKLIILEGPSGTGKTTVVNTVVKKFIDKYPGRFFYKEIMTHDVTNGVETEIRINELFDSIYSISQRDHKVVILLFDEADELLYSRKNALHIRTERTSNLMKGINRNIPNVYIIGTTNRPNQIDKAAYDRFQEQIHCPIPLNSEIRKLIDIYFKDMNPVYQERLWGVITDISEPKDKFSGRDILHLSERISDVLEIKQLTTKDYELVFFDIAEEIGSMLNSKAHRKDDYLDDED